MTFTAIKQAVKEYLNLTSSDADARVGAAVNRHYRRVTSLLGLDAVRFTTVTTSMSLGVRTVTFSGIGKVDRIADTSDSTAIRPLKEVSVDELRSTQPSEGEPCRWALQNTGADSVAVLFDTVPQVAYSLQADGWGAISDLTGNQEPAFDESFHDILVWFAISEELLKKEKDRLAAIYEQKAEKLLSDLRFHLQDTHSRDLRQGGRQHSGYGAGGSGGGSGNVGGTNYTQSGLITFDRDPEAPFAVTSGSDVVTNLDADLLDGQHATDIISAASAQAAADILPVNLATDATGRVALTNLPEMTTDRLLGRDTASTGNVEELAVSGGVEFSGSGGIRRSALTGDVTAAAGSNATTIANDAVTYAKMQNVSAASRLLGRGSAAGAGDTEELTVGSGLSLSGTALSALITTGIRQIVSAAGSSNFTTTSTSLVDVTGMAVSLTTGASANVLVLVQVPCAVAGGNSALFDWNLDTTDGGTIQGVITSSTSTTLTLFKLFTGLSAASHTITLRVRSSGGSTVTINMSGVMAGAITALEYR